MQPETLSRTDAGAIASYAARVLRGEVPPPPIAQTLGLELVSVTAGQAVVAYRVDLGRHANPMGTLHGGVLCDLADLAMGIAYGSTLLEDESFTTAELALNFLRPAREGTLTAVARLVHAGRTLGLVECDVIDERGRLVARAKSTCMTLRKAQQHDGRPA
ncbi:MAG TPA: PaaI family thioesterase [Dehalococcoidia bacterium]|nr:PaaI family thioesterase [Dehalococcoidia bacterium]